MTNAERSLLGLVRRWVPGQWEEFGNLLRPVPRERDLEELLLLGNVRALGQRVVPVLFNLIQNFPVAVKGALHGQASTDVKHGHPPLGPVIVHSRPLNLVLHKGDVVVVHLLGEQLLLRNAELRHVFPRQVHASAFSCVLPDVAENVRDLERHPERERGLPEKSLEGLTGNGGGEERRLVVLFVQISLCRPVLSVERKDIRQEDEIKHKQRASIMQNLLGLLLGISWGTAENWHGH